MGVILELLSAPRLQKVSIAMADVATGETPIPDIHLASLRYLQLLSRNALPWITPYIKAPKPEELALKVPSGVPVTIVNDLFPLESYPLMAEVTSMCFRGGAKGVQVTFRGENTKVSLDIYFPIFEDLRDFFPDSD